MNRESDDSTYKNLPILHYIFSLLGLDFVPTGHDQPTLLDGREDDCAIGLEDALFNNLERIRAAFRKSCNGAGSEGDEGGKPSTPTVDPLLCWTWF